ncbi:MAG: DNA replication/repair protein RecF [Bacteroides sp.]|nr:DNA replication/repair protein RecF [Bacteroides sp.]MCM1379429.1 DNA replication/repair protein RecF [Bacteroides sp.]MCM1445289.1 DNA replication/repair protein RecF [Prevotella sp.]
MQLKSLALDNFKNIAEARLEFSPKVNGLLGRNGMGKSNLLDAIYTLSFTKSFCRVPDAMLIRSGEQFAMVRGQYERRGVDEDVTLGLTDGKRKSLKRKGKEYQRMSEHIGVFPLVMVSPADVDLVRESPDERRRWMDMVISQSDPRYLDALIRYNRALEQRNRLLKDGVSDTVIHESLITMMQGAADYLYEVRTDWVERLRPIFSKFYGRISDGSEQPGLCYVSQRQEYVSYEEMMAKHRDRDFILRHTSAGPHRDDIELTLNGMDMRRTGSQGQCKTFVIALRLAQYEFLQQATGMKPLLLLDDIFDKLDATRVEAIVRLVDDPAFGQIFITDTNRSHLDEIMTRTGGDYRLWEVRNGAFTPLHYETN